MLILCLIEEKKLVPQLEVRIFFSSNFQNINKKLYLRHNYLALLKEMSMDAIDLLQ